MLLVVQKRFAIFAILFGIAAGYYRQGAGRKDPGRERADPRQDRQDAKWAAEKLKTPAWYNAPPSPYGHYCQCFRKARCLKLWGFQKITYNS